MHPAIVAQASATLAAMYPGRHWLGLGSGEALNEHVIGGYWPETPERIARMFEAIEIIRKLFIAGKDVKHDGTLLQDRDDPPVDPARRAAADLIATAGPITAKKTGRSPTGSSPSVRRRRRSSRSSPSVDEGCSEAGNDPTKFR